MSSNDLNYEISNKDNSQFDLSFKLIVIGNSGVGKSCLTIKAIKNKFADFYYPTIGFEFFSFNLKIEDVNIKLQIWDTCGQEAYRSIINSFYRNSSLAIIVYAIDDKQSFKDLESWLNDIKSKANPDIKIILIGNKVDLEDKREVEKEMGEKFCKDNDLCLFMETSAKTGLNAQNLFIEAAKILFEQHRLMMGDSSRPGNISILPYIPEPIIIDETDKERKKACSC